MFNRRLSRRSRTPRSKKNRRSRRSRTPRSRRSRTPRSKRNRRSRKIPITSSVKLHVMSQQPTNIATIDNSELLCIGDYCVDKNFLNSMALTHEKYKPIDCNLTKWSPWSNCSKKCDSGVKHRNRTNNITGNNIFSLGKLCNKPLSESEECNTQSCVKHCAVSDWNEWGECNKECGVGTKTRQREITQHPTLGGNECPSLVDSEECKKTECPIDCELSPWQGWTECVPEKGSCGPGNKTNHRTVIINPKFGGKECGVLSKTEKCNDKPCPLDCQVSDWTQWSNCTPESHNCGIGKQSRNRKVTRTALHDGAACPELVETEECDSNIPCPIDCELSEWNDWSKCVPDSGACGSGKLTRTRNITTSPKHGGKKCNQVIETKKCEIPCPTDCSVGEWTNIGECKPVNGKCGKGIQQQSRTVIAPKHGGTTCPTNNEQKVSCDAGPCATDCSVGEWTNIGECKPVNGKCGKGIQQQSRTVIAPKHGGTSCPTNNEQKVSCDAGPCATDCSIGQWTNVGHCNVTNGKKVSKDCTKGTQKQIRKTKQPTLGGKPCPTDNTRNILCYGGICPKNILNQSCVMGQWNNWTSCIPNQGTCGTGTQIRERKVVTGEKNCGLTTETKSCELKCNPIDCEVSDWGNWTNCNFDTQNRIRTIIKEPKYGGHRCPPLIEAKKCGAYVVTHIDTLNTSSVKRTGNKVISVDDVNGLVLKGLYRSGSYGTTSVTYENLLNNKPTLSCSGYIPVTNEGGSLIGKYNKNIVLTNYTMILVCNISSTYHPRDSTWSTVMSLSKQNDICIRANGQKNKKLFYKHNDSYFELPKSIEGKNTIIVTRYNNVTKKLQLNYFMNRGNSGFYDKQNVPSKQFKLDGISIGSDMTNWWGHNINVSEFKLYGGYLDDLATTDVVKNLLEKWNFN